jgi:hypothetical protein
MEEMVAHENIVWSAHRVFLRTGSDVRSVLAVIEAWTGHTSCSAWVGTLFGRNRNLGVRRRPDLAVELEGSM